MSLTDGPVESEGLLAAILDSMEDGLTVLDRDLNILYANRPMQGFHRAALPLEGKSCYVAYRNQTKPCEDCPCLRAVESGLAEKTELVVNGENYRDGIWELVAQPILNEEGEVTSVVEIARDVTAVREAEALRNEQQEIFQALFENNISAMLLIDPESAVIRDANTRACEFYGHSRAELQNMKVKEINILSEAEIIEEMERAKAEKRNYFNFFHRVADGSVREVEVFSGPITVGGKPLLCSIIHDISGRKAAEREMEGLVHDLQLALAEVKTLRGLIPICAACSQIRDEEGHWSRIEDYISQNSDAELTHGICPKCIKELYPDFCED